MSTTIQNPIVSDPGAAVAAERLKRGDAGNLLAIYGCARRREATGDALADLGGPLIDFLIASSGERPESVSAMRNQRGAFDHWSLVVACASGLKMSIDVGQGFGDAQLDDLDLRIEWSGDRQVLQYEPNRIGVTVLRASGAVRRSCAVVPVADELRTAAGTQFASAEPVLRAARAAAASGKPVTV